MFTFHVSRLTAHCPLPTAHCPLPTAHCPLPTAHCPPPTAHRLLTTDPWRSHDHSRVRVAKKDGCKQLCWLEACGYNAGGAHLGCQ
jgi:hypothetical protein